MTFDDLKLWDMQEVKLRKVVSSEIESALLPIQRKLDLIENQLNAISGLVNQEARSEAKGHESSKGQSDASEQEVIILRDVSGEQAKAEIEDLFRNTADSLYYSDIMETLEIDLELVVSVCNELLDEGKIEYGDKSIC